MAKERTATSVAGAANRHGRLARAITRHQAILFFPLLTVEGLNLHAASVSYLRRRRSAKLRRTETVLLAMHTLGYLGAIFLLLPPALALAFIAVHQAVFGLYMGCSFAPNHKGMPIIAAADDELDYLRRQVLTSRNVRGGWFVDQLLGGLNYQIEHHLFPSTLRPNLRHAQHPIRDYCAQHRIRYTEGPHRLLRHRAATPARPRQTAARRRLSANGKEDLLTARGHGMTNGPTPFEVHQSGVLLHGTRADLALGDLLTPGYRSNYEAGRVMNHVYVTETLDAAVWGAELAVGEGPGRIYLVEPTGELEDWIRSHA